MTLPSSLSLTPPGERRATNHGGLLLLVALNMVPLAGVLLWGWQSFDLIFLYWLENVVIGAFVLARIVIRPSIQRVERLIALGMGAFFLIHYGMFCYGHGSFVVGLFEPSDTLGDVSGLYEVTRAMLSRPQVLLAFSALVLLQLFDWLKDIRELGLGGQPVAKLMTEPYGRIVVLHLAIIGSGFLLIALDEPVAGLVMLIAVKTLADCRKWLRDGAGEKSTAEPHELTEDQLKKLGEEFSEPKLTVNGETRHFESFAELKASPEFRTLLSVSTMFGGGSKLKLMVNYLEQKIAEEESAGSLSRN